MSGDSVSPSPGNLATCQKSAVSLPSGVRDCPHILEVVGSPSRWYLEEEQQRTKRDPEEIEVAALPQVYNDPVLKKNQKLYHSFVRDVSSRKRLTPADCRMPVKGVAFQESGYTER